MSTSIEIWNMAMMKIGADRITAASPIDEAQLEAQLADTIYYTEKKSLLRSYAWNCATKRVTLAQLAEQPANLFAYAFALPDDYLRVLRVMSGDYELPNINPDGNRAYVVEGKAVLTNATNIVLQYVANIDESLFDPHVEEALVAKICFESIYAIGESASAQSNFGAIYEGKLNEARITDSLENPHVVLRVDNLNTVRY